MHDEQDLQLTDEQLAGRVQQGNTDAFGLLVERYEEKLLRYGRKFITNRQDIEDIVQEVFLGAYQSIQNFNVSRRFSPWIYRIAHNAFVNALRTYSHNPLRFFDFDTLFFHSIRDEQAEIDREIREIQDMINSGLERIEPKYREVLILHYIEGFKYKEIAEVLRVPVGTVGIRLKRAKKILREIYKKIQP